MTRKKKLHTGIVPIGGKVVKSRRVARVITSKYHKLRNEFEAKREILVKSKIDDLKRVESEFQIKLDEIGGIDAYQKASAISTQHFQTSKWIIKMLKCLHKNNSIEKLNVLEVGAINIQMKQCKSFNVRAIDINSQHPLIEECDFFDLEPQRNYDAVVCSMVINCVTDPCRRFDMLARLAMHIEPLYGLIVLVLPIRCINTGTITREKFEALLSGLGLIILSNRITPKIIFYILAFKASYYSTHSSAHEMSGNKKIESKTWKQIIISIMKNNMDTSTKQNFCHKNASKPDSSFSITIDESYFDLIVK